MIINAAFVLLVFLYSLASERLERTIFTAPIVFTAAGVLLILALPVLGELEADRKAFLLLADWLPFLSRWSVFDRMSASDFLVLVIGVQGGYALLGYEPLLMTSQGIDVVVCLVATLVVLRFMLSTGTSTSERIFAALSADLMIGIICELLFFLFEEEWPGSFSCHFRGSKFLVRNSKFQISSARNSFAAHAIPTKGP